MKLYLQAAPVFLHIQVRLNLAAQLPHLLQATHGPVRLRRVEVDRPEGATSF